MGWFWNRGADPGERRFGAAGAVCREGAGCAGRPPNSRHPAGGERRAGVAPDRGATGMGRNPTRARVAWIWRPTSFMFTRGGDATAGPRRNTLRAVTALGAATAARANPIRPAAGATGAVPCTAAAVRIWLTATIRPNRFTAPPANRPSGIAITPFGACAFSSPAGRTIGACAPGR